MSGSGKISKNQKDDISSISNGISHDDNQGTRKETSFPIVPLGLQKLLRLASVDSQFCEELIRRREKAAYAAGIQLTSSERAMVRSISDNQIRDMVQFLPKPAMDRRNFFRQAAKAAVLLLVTGTMAQCKKTKKNDGSDKGESTDIKSGETESGHDVKEEIQAENNLRSIVKKSKIEEAPVEAAGTREMGGLGGIAPDTPKRKPEVKVRVKQVKGKLNSSTVRRVLRRHKVEILYCYMSKGLLNDRELHGQVEVRFAISQTGVVTSVEVLSTTLNHTKTEECIVKSIKRWRFPKPENDSVMVDCVYEFRSETS